LLRNRV
ncbi:nitrogen fixation NifW family protein, partial [Vibrio parahaemolyticus V-223/04]